MHFLLIGATGRTGTFVTATALANNHKVTALIRNPTPSLPTSDENLSTILGTPFSQADVERAFNSSQTAIDAVIITLTAKPDFLLNCVRNVTHVMRAHGVKRLVVLSAFGVGSSAKNLSWPLKALFRYTSLADENKEHSAVDEALHAGEGEGIEWTLVRPPMLKDGEAKSVREFGEEGSGVGMFDSITRASVAEVLVRAAVEGKWKGQAIVVAN